MPIAARLLILFLGVGLFFLVFELVRKKKLREELSVIWLFFAVIVSLGSVTDIVLDPLAKRLHIHYPPALAFALILIVLIFAFLYFSLVTSDLKSKVKELTQKIALLESEVNEKRELKN